MEEVTALSTYVKLMRAAESLTARIHRNLAEAGVTISQFGTFEVTGTIPMPGEALTLGVSAPGSFTANCQGYYYRVTVEAGKDLEIAFDDLDDAGVSRQRARGR